MEKGGRVLAAVLLLAIALIDGLALKEGKVFFLYEEEKEVMAFVKEHAEETSFR